jgi:hypothetical protein
MVEQVFEQRQGYRAWSWRPWHDRFMVDWARARREAMRKQADLRRRLAAAERALADAGAMVAQAEAEFDAASDRFADAESALDAARAERARSRQERYQARQAHERASTTVERLQRRVDELGGRLGRMPPLTLVPGDVSGAGTLPLCVRSPPFTGRGRRAKGTPQWVASVPCSHSHQPSSSRSWLSPSP